MMVSISLLDSISAAYASIQEFLFANIAGPILYQLDLMAMAEDLMGSTGFYLAVFKSF